MLALTLAACTSSVTRAPEPALQIPQFDEPGEQAGALSIILSDEAKKDAEDSPIFDLGRLYTDVHNALAVNRLLSPWPQPDPSLPAIEITVTSVHVRSASAAFHLGFLAGSDHVDGDVVVWAPDGSELQRFSVSASSAIGGFSGYDRIYWIYENFAERVVEELTGKTQH
jgi:hypothetical protein